MIRFSSQNKILSLFLVITFLLMPITLDAQLIQEMADISTPDTIQTQIMKPKDTQIPYAVTGESLVNLIANMVDFEIKGASVIFNRATGQLIIKNTPTNLSKIEDILFELRRAAFKQIEIESRIITVTSDDINSLGLETGSFDINTAFKNAVGTFGASGTNEISFPDVTERDSSTSFGQEFVLGILNKRADIDLVIDSLKSKAEVNTVSAPRITVFNNQRANIRIVNLRSFVSEVDGDIETSGDRLFFSIDTVIRQAPSGTVLDVTPTVNSDGTITLALHPTFVRVDMGDAVNLSTVTESQNGTGSTLASNSVLLPTFTEQTLDTTVVIPDGGVAVLGGLIDETETKTLNSIPYFSSIPILGRLFKNEQNRDEKSHLIIFIKATSRYVDENGRIVR